MQHASLNKDLSATKKTDENKPSNAQPQGSEIASSESKQFKPSVELDLEKVLVSSLNMDGKSYSQEDEIDLDHNLTLLADKESPILATDVSLNTAVEDVFTVDKNEHHQLVSMDLDLAASLDEIKQTNVVEASKNDTYLTMMQKVGKVETLPRNDKGSRRVFAQVESFANNTRSRSNDTEFLNSDSIPLVKVIDDENDDK